MRIRFLWVLFVVLSVALSLGGCGPDEEDAAPSATATIVSRQPSATPTAAPTETRAISPSDTPAVVPTSTVLASPSATAASTQIPASETPPPTLAPTSSPSPVPTSSPTLTPSPSPELAAVRLELQPLVGGLELPVGIASAGDGSDRLFIVEKVGRIRIVQQGVLAPEPFLDITDRVGASQSEQGLLGLAFHPGYAGNGLFFVNYTDARGDTVVSRFSVSGDPARADPGSEVVVLTLDQPAANHNGGHLAFGPDGYLYIGTGDGGGAGDRYGNGQNGQTLLGAMLRLDVDRGQPYAIPEDNPFLGNPAVRDEIWALGLRNPWRYSFDRGTGDLYIADVGQNVYEEIDHQPAGDPGGQNYGWPIMEGLHCFPADQPCDRSRLTLPVGEYDHTQGCSVTGGYVYRGQEFPPLTGIYLFGDYCSGSIWGLAPMGKGGDWQLERLAQTDVRLSAFGQDEVGELYLVNIESGELLRITSR